MRKRTPRFFRASRQRISLVLCGALAAGLLQATALTEEVAAVESAKARVSSDSPVKGTRGSEAEPRAVTKGPRTPAGVPRHSWPGATTKILAPTTGRGAGSKPPNSADGGLIKVAPVAPHGAKGRLAGKQTGSASPGAPGRVNARVLSRGQARKAGVEGLVFALTPMDKGGVGEGPVSVSVDYDTFSGAYGGAYSSRLRFVRYPACLLTSPEKRSCRTATPLAADNDTTAHTLTVPAMTLRSGGPTVLAAAAAPAGDKGDYKATSLSDSGSWSTSLNSGDFNWSYDITVPDTPGDLQPDLKLSYSSGAIDGRTTNTNNQGAWVGDGFDLGTGSIERRYKPCSDDGVKNADGSKPGDLCWAYDNAFLSFNGKGGELVPVSKDEFKLKQDDGTRIDRLYSTARGNGDADGEYWRLTDPSGVRYYFGYNRLPGWAAGKDETNSTFNVPVFGNNAGEKCHQDDFASSWCQQAWRWNLDYVVDTHGNAMAYHYEKESNSYGRNLKEDDDTSYTRGGYLTRIDYGLKSNRMFADKPMAQAVFTSAERCLPETGVTCAASTVNDKSFYWYDTPWDLNCDSGATCDKGRLAPTFWTRKRLTGITTQVLNTAGGYDRSDSWAFSHRWGMADTDYQLLLESVQHTGQSASPAVTLPKTSFAYGQLANRLDKTGDGYAPFIKDRLTSVDGETGSRTDVEYSDPVCDWKTLPAPESNTTRCFPQVLDQEQTADAPDVQWFNKYVTTAVTVSDRTGGAPDQITRYAYEGPAAWHYADDDGLTKEKYRTWSQWRGYGQVHVRSGGLDSMKSQQDSFFLRGMDGDRKDKSGGTKPVSVALGTGEGDPITDHEALAGFAYKSATYDKPDGKILTKSVSRPWHHETAKKVRAWGTVTADFIGTAEARTWTSLDDGAGVKWRTTNTETTQDTVAGRVTEVNDLGDTSTPDDDQCSRTTYATNATANILDTVGRIETVAKACTQTPDRTKDVISDVRTAYDGGAYGAEPVKGDPTGTAGLKSHTGTKATYLETGTTYDAYGRPLAVNDLTADVTVDGASAPVRTARGDGRTTTTAYSPATGRATQVRTTSPPAKAGDSTTSLTSVQELDPVRGQVIKETDPNGNTAETRYDAAGRTTEVWEPGRATTRVPSYQFTYQVADGQPTVVGTRKVNNNDGQTAPAYTLYDGLLRERQTQDPGPDGGSIVSDVFYDERGLSTKTFAPYFTTGGPAKKIFQPEDALAVESQTRTDYDGLGRSVQSKQIAGNGDGGAVLNTTKTVYGGDRTTVIPPAGGTATTTVTDARGHTTQLQTLHQRALGAAADTTRYAYDARGSLKSVTDPAGNNWTYAYDQMGRQTKAADPDKGATETVYDDRGQVDHTKDSRGVLLYTGYDNQGRKTELHEGTPGGTLRAKWTYDTVPGGKGLPAESTRYEDGQPYTSKVTAYDALSRPYRTAVVIPAVEGALAGTYQSGTLYKPSGLVAGTSSSPAGALPGATTVYSYDDTTLWPTGVTTDGMSGKTTYTHVGLSDTVTLGLSGGTRTTEIKNGYEWGTRRLASSVVSRMEQPGIDRSAVYHYDEAGNVTSVADTSRTGADNQCYGYDYLGRLTDAWSQASTACSATPGAAAIGGAAPYWQSYSYDLTGNRTAETDHDPAHRVGKDTRHEYSYPPAGTSQAHSLGAVTTSGPAGTSTDKYTYDQAGNTKTRPGQTLTWDAEGHLASVAEGGKTTQYLYDPDGNRLIARAPTGTTLYLGGTELTLAKGADKPRATRYTDLGGGNTAVQDDDRTFSYTIPDHQGTGLLAVDATNLAIQQRRTSPFGGARGSAPADWPGSKGFVGGTDDSGTTGLQHLGAREYDPATGRFLSVDPVMDLTDPQQMNGYTYGNNNPVTKSDPDGLKPTGMCGPAGICPDGTREHFKVNDSGVWTQELTTTHQKSRNDGSTEYTNNHYVNGKVVAKQFLTVSESGEIYYGKLPERGNRYLRILRDTFDFLVFDTKLASKCADEITAECGWLLADLPVGKIAKVAKLEKAGRVAEVAKHCKCFLAGTDVLMADGSTQDIEDVKVGDKVRATDPVTGKTRARKVTRLIRTNGDKFFNKISIAAKDGITSVTATDEHPFWSPSEHAWVEAGDLAPGMTLLSDDGSTVIVTANKAFTKHARTYNLTVDELHTYYVLAGATPVLVHNSGPCGISTRTEKAGDIGKYTEGQKTRDPASQWYHEELSNEELLDGINNPGKGDGLLVSRDGTILGGHHRWDELQTRVRDGRIDPDTPIRVDVYDPE
ncbi:polymorphic toxin-type HINT domain-containing protein [Streptomyces sp. NBC_01471]|uniref:polymorphic toxin-type HINT domain-containing protein n=1 Tax=Streptomyces sp. NBC_01471 TaxID=2903879 RepID=UPI00352CC53F